jgi:hypothetical protein
VQLELKNLSVLTKEFHEGYYYNEDSVREAIQNKTVFNIIDHKSSFKADLLILKNQPYRQTEFGRRRQIEFQSMKIFVVSAEDLLLSKIIWIQELQSNMQMEDIKVLGELNGFDWNYVHYWIKTLNLNTLA